MTRFERAGTREVSAGCLATRPPAHDARVASRRQLGLLWGGVATALVLASPWAERLAARLPSCPFRALSGMPCPACGSGGAALALAHFDVSAALAASPLATAGWIALVGGGLAAGVAALCGRALPGIPARLPSRARAAILAVVLANWVYLIAR